MTIGKACTAAAKSTAQDWGATFNANDRYGGAAAETPLL
jgi:hypothetical protein